MGKVPPGMRPVLPHAIVDAYAKRSSAPSRTPSRPAAAKTLKRQPSPTRRPRPLRLPVGDDDDEDDTPSAAGSTPGRAVAKTLNRPTSCSPTPVDDDEDVSFPSSITDASSFSCAVRFLLSPSSSESPLPALRLGAAAAPHVADLHPSSVLPLLRLLPVQLAFPYLSVLLARSPSLSRSAPSLAAALSDTLLSPSRLRSSSVTSLLSLVPGLLAAFGTRPDAYFYNTIMKARIALGDHGSVLTVYRRMTEDGVEPDLVTYNTLIFGLATDGMVDHARRFFDVMAKAGLFPDVATYTALISGMCRKGDAAGALKILEEMREKGCNPNEHTWNTLLMGLCKARCVDKGFEVYKGMVAAGMHLDSPAYGTLVRALCRANKVADAYEVFDYAIESESPSRMTAYTELESSLRRMRRMTSGSIPCLGEHQLASFG